MLSKILDFYFYCVLRKPWLALLLLAAVTLGLASQLPNLKIDASSDALTLEYDQDLDFFREISKRYQSGDFLVVTYTAKDDLFSDKSLAHISALRDELLTIEGVQGANSILDVPLLYSPPVGFTELGRGLKTLADAGVDRTLAQQEFLDSPIYKDMLLGPNKKTTAILLNLELDETFIEMVRKRDGMRLKRDTEGLTAAEQQDSKRYRRLWRKHCGICLGLTDDYFSPVAVCIAPFGELLNHLNDYVRLFSHSGLAINGNLIELCGLVINCEYGHCHLFGGALSRNQ